MVQHVALKRLRQRRLLWKRAYRRTGRGSKGRLGFRVIVTSGRVGEKFYHDRVNGNQEERVIILYLRMVSLQTRHPDLPSMSQRRLPLDSLDFRTWQTVRNYVTSFPSFY